MSEVNNLFDAQRMVASSCKLPVDEAIVVVNNIAFDNNIKLDIYDWIDLADWTSNYKSAILTYRELKCYIGTMPLRIKNVAR